MVLQSWVIVVLLLFFVPSGTHADNSNNNAISTNWFWPLLGICLALLLSVPCTLISIILICHGKHRAEELDQSSCSSSSASSPVPPSRSRRLPPRSHFADGFRSPPPPYTTTNQDLPENIFITSSLPPSYDSHETDSEAPVTGSPQPRPRPPPPRPVVIPMPPRTNIQVAPMDISENYSLQTTAIGTTLDVSTTLTNPSIQTFQV